MGTRSGAESSSKTAASNETTNVISQENASMASKNNRNRSRSSRIKQQIRHRASVACASCRDRRIRCVVPQGQNECNQCRRGGTECVIKNDDERRRPISKAYTSSLSDRISMLEGMLLDKGVVPPPAQHPPRTRHDPQGNSSEEKKSANDEGVTLRERPRTRASSLITPPVPAEVPSPPDSLDGVPPEALRANSETNDKEDSRRQNNHTNDGSQYPPPPLPPPGKEDSSFRMLEPKEEDIVHRLLSAKGNLSFDQLCGRLRFFGPTASEHVYATETEQSGRLHDECLEPPEQIRRAERMIRSLGSGTHDYLMDCFWEHYNSVVRIIDRRAFEEDRDNGCYHGVQGPRYYSSFLSIAVLAMGYRIADKDREDMRRITLGPRESTLHREAKYMLDVELERPGGIPSVQALLLLGDLETGLGRDTTGWMYSGMANRLAFDIGLHLDCRDNGLSERDLGIRRLVMRACVIYDKYWALFLGRPTSIKSQDMSVDLLSSRISSLASVDHSTQGPQSGEEKSIEAEVQEQLMELMELAGRIVENRDGQHHHHQRRREEDSNNMFSASEAEDDAYLKTCQLDRQLQTWYRRLPDRLTWKPANIEIAPFSFFLLHQQWHVSMILLHRPWAKYGAITDPDSRHPSSSTAHHACQNPVDVDGEQPLTLDEPHRIVSDSRTLLSRSICTQQAIRTARIFSRHRARFDGSKIFVTGIQHAGTAAIALIAAASCHRREVERLALLSHLEVLADAIADMSQTYQPASRIDRLLQAVLKQMKTGSSQPSSNNDQHSIPLGGMPAPLVPCRRDMSEADSIQKPQKRQRPGSGRRASEITRPPPPFYPLAECPPLTSQRNSFSGDMAQRSHNAHSMEQLEFPIDAGEGGDSFSLDFLSGSAIDVESVTQSSESWEMDSSLPGGSFMSKRPCFSAHYGYGGDGPAGLSASSVISQSAALATGLMSGSYLGSKASGNDTGKGDLDDDILGIVEDSFGAMSPGMDVDDQADGSSSRNPNLDFFNFSSS